MRQTEKKRELLKTVPPEVDALAAQAVEAAFRVHRALGPGLLETVYHVCLCHELSKMGVPFEHELDWPVQYEGVRVDAGLRLDFWLDRRLILELKTVETLLPVHKAQLMTYMKLTDCLLGLLINFNVPLLKDGIVRVIL